MPTLYTVTHLIWAAFMGKKFRESWSCSTIRWTVIKHSGSHHENWQRAWRNPTPKKKYDVIVIGGGGHGLATAYYLAKEFGVSNVAVVEKGYLGGGNTGRNTTIVRSNYLWDEAAHLYEHAMGLWEGSICKTLTTT